MAVFNEDGRILQEKTWKMICEPQVVSPKEPSPMTINMTIAEFEQTAPDGYEDFTWAYGLICVSGCPSRDPPSLSARAMTDARCSPRRYSSPTCRVGCGATPCTGAA